MQELYHPDRLPGEEPLTAPLSRYMQDEPVASDLLKPALEASIRLGTATVTDTSSPTHASNTLSVTVPLLTVASTSSASEAAPRPFLVQWVQCQ